MPGLVLAVLTWFGAWPAAAQPDAAPVAVEVDACVPVERVVFDRLLSLELGTSAQARPAGEYPVTRVEVTCGDHGVELRVIDPLTRKTMHRTLQAEPLRGDGAERLLALAVSEFVVASWVELSLQSEHQVEPVGERPPQRAVKAAQERVAMRKGAPATPIERETRTQGDMARVRLGAGLGYLAVLNSHGPSWLGGRLTLMVRLLDQLYWELHAEAMFGDLQEPAGTVSSNLLGARSLVSYDLRPSAGVRLGLGIGFLLARMQYSAVPESSTMYAGSKDFERVGGPLVSGRLALATGAQSDLGLRVDLGILSLPVELSTEGAGLTLDASGAFVCLSLDLLTSL